MCRTVSKYHLARHIIDVHGSLPGLFHQLSFFVGSLLFLCFRLVSQSLFDVLRHVSQCIAVGKQF